MHQGRERNRSKPPAAKKTHSERDRPVRANDLLKIEEKKSGLEVCAIRLKRERSPLGKFT
jgi:hypothetical protein